MTPPPDLLRLLAIPAFAWLSWEDHRTRRIPRRVWYPLAGLGAVALLWDIGLVLGQPPVVVRLFVLRVGISLGILGPMAYAFYRLGWFGGADAKAFVVLAILFPTYPTYGFGSLTFPLQHATAGVFSLTVITNGVLVGALYPIVVTFRNVLTGRFSPAMVVGRPVGWEAIATTHGKLVGTPAGFTLSGLDLDALRMYLRWRGTALADLKADPETYRLPSSLPLSPNPPTDGVVDPSLDPAPEASKPSETHSAAVDDPWGAMAFLDDVGTAYGTTPEQLRAGLDLLVDADTVWISPGIPFLIPVFAGLLVGLTYGDLLYGLLTFLGFV